MKKLVTKPNVDSATTAYPYGNMRDRAAGIQGSEMNTQFHTDYVQFFEKMFAESGLTANGLPDNVTNGFQLFEAARISIKGYKTYSGFLSQTGTGAPTFVSEVNEIGNIVWTRGSTGIYTGTLTGAFTNTVIGLAEIQDRGFAMFQKDSNNTIDLETRDLGVVYRDGILSATFIEIRAYIQ